MQPISAFPAPAPRPPRPPHLADRETAVLRLLAAGASNAVIGADLGLTLNSVKAVVRRIMEKLSADGREHTAALGVAHRLVRPEDIRPEGPHQPPALGDEDVAILRLLAASYSNKTIAVRCYLSETTADSRITVLIAVLGARARVHAAALGVLLGLVPLGDLHPDWPPMPLSAEPATGPSAGRPVEAER